ncbi:MAG: hypothetical protein MZU95_07245 [Desulfomicrobium escambiense]|nr:hypothetical protein [Desulfomicrobium escambiense]
MTVRSKPVTAARDHGQVQAPEGPRPGPRRRRPGHRRPRLAGRTGAATPGRLRARRLPGEGPSPCPRGRAGPDPDRRR